MLYLEHIGIENLETCINPICINLTLDNSKAYERSCIFKKIKQNYNDIKKSIK